jgi:hypothetical protein
MLSQAIRDRLLSANLNDGSGLIADYPRRVRFRPEPVIGHPASVKGGGHDKYQRPPQNSSGKSFHIPALFHKGMIDSIRRRLRGNSAAVVSAVCAVTRQRPNVAQFLTLPDPAYQQGATSCLIQTLTPALF